MATWWSPFADVPTGRLLPAGSKDTPACQPPRPHRSASLGEAVPSNASEWTMPRKSIGETAMTDAERQARYRTARAAGKPVIRVRRALDHRGRARRWNDNVAGLVEGQVEYAAWLDSLPENLRDSALAEALQA